MIMLDVIENNRNKLEKMIITNEKYEKVLKQSQKLDKLLNKYIKTKY